jgi:hypothetical protein
MKISSYQRNRIRKPHSEEAKENMRITAKGRDMSIQIANSVKARKGRPSHNRCPIYSVNDKGSIIKYDSITEASKLTGILISAIANNLRNKSKKAGGLTWHYQHEN